MMTAFARKSLTATDLWKTITQQGRAVCGACLDNRSTLNCSPNPGEPHRQKLLSMNCSDAVFLGRQQFLRAARQDLHEPIARTARLALRDSRLWRGAAYSSRCSQQWHPKCFRANEMSSQTLARLTVE